MKEILEKYRKYEIEYIFRDCILIIHKSIPVKKFVEFKKDLVKRKICVGNIIVEERNRKYEI